MFLIYAKAVKKSLLLNGRNFLAAFLVKKSGERNEEEIIFPTPPLFLKTSAGSEI